MESMKPHVNPSTLVDTEIGIPSIRSTGSEAGTSRATQTLVLSVKTLNEVTGRHQRGFDTEGSEGT